MIPITALEQPITASEPPSRRDAFVELEKVTHTYGRGERQVHALTETDLRIEQGDFVALVGPSGCGKSTILKLVTGLINASSGYVYVAGRQVGAEPDHETSPAYSDSGYSSSQSSQSVEFGSSTTCGACTGGAMASIAANAADLAASAASLASLAAAAF